ncbi:MAG TPA: glycosyltransferase, partial [Patescibacteria group bacterium]|nr:glycosyltransferase [Patescibacteria group bacterium]
MKTSLIITTLNEQNTVADFIKSAVEQTVLPTELIIIDGGSADTTLEKIISSAQKYKKLSIIYSIKKGNRSVGRNEGVKLSHYDILLFSDAGCILDKNWVEEITRPLTDKTIDVIA